MNIEVSGKTIGADVTEFDIPSELDDRSFSAVESAFYDRSVLCFRDQQLGPEQLLAFARRFGEPDVHFLRHYAHPLHPNILLVSNIQENGQPLGFADAGRVWHSDGSYMQTPVAVSMLYAIEVPEEDGRALGVTQFASAWAAYDGLPAETKHQIEELVAIHQVAGRRRNIGTGLDGDRAHEEAQPDARHPLVRTHPITGRRYLFVNKGECTKIIGLDDAEGLPLIERLADAVQAPEYRHDHQWRVGDLLIWDNQAVQHVATFDYQWPQHRRLMHRITITECTQPTA